MTQQPLTERQQEVLDAIRGFQTEHGYSPSVRDLVGLFGFKSPQAISCHLKPLAKKGWITWDRMVARSITLVGTEKRRCPHCNGLLNVHRTT